MSAGEEPWLARGSYSMELHVSNRLCESHLIKCFPHVVVDLLHVGKLTNFLLK